MKAWTVLSLVVLDLTAVLLDRDPSVLRPRVSVTTMRKNISSIPIHD